MTKPTPREADDPGFPPSVRDAAAGADLGVHRAGFGPVTADSIVWFVIFAMAFGVLTVLLLIGGTLFALLPAALVGLFIYLATQRIRTNSEFRNARLDVFQRGLVVTGAQRPRTVRFDQTTVLQEIVHHTVNGRHNHSTYKYVLNDISATPLTLHATTGGVTAGFPQPERWGPMIQRAVTEEQFPAAWTAIESGNRLEFGKFWLTRHHIGTGKKEWLWSQVNQIRVHNGLIQLKSDGRWGSLTDSEVSRIPNYFIFTALAERLAATR